MAIYLVENPYIFSIYENYSRDPIQHTELYVAYYIYQIVIFLTTFFMNNTTK
jgi:hypothetical protein